MILAIVPFTTPSIGYAITSIQFSFESTNVNIKFSL